MAYTKVTSAQFTWAGDTLVHKPTGARFSWTYANPASDDVTVNWKSAGDVLPNGEDYDREEIGRLAAALLKERR